MAELGNGKQGRVASILLLALACGCARANCSGSSRLRSTALDAAPASSVEPLTSKPALDDRTGPVWIQALRDRRWTEAEAALSSSNEGLANQPRLLLAHAYALAKTDQFGRAWALLQGLEKNLPELTPQILRLRAETGLHTAQAAAAADWLATQGEPQAHVRAASTFLVANNLSSALSSVTRAIDLLTPLHDDASRSALAEAHRVRAQVYQGRGAPELAAADWLWLEIQAPTHPAASGADALWEKATGLRLSVEQRLTRAVALAKAGMLQATEAELEQLQSLPHAPLAAGYSDWLLGKARSRARLDHVQGARMLERSIVAQVEDPDSLRIESARLYLRGGKENEAIRVVEPILKKRGSRSGEAQALVARAHGIVGDYTKALRAYDALLGKNKPKNKDDLAFEQAVSAVLAGYPKRALTLFDAIAQNERRESLRARAAELAAVAALEAELKDEAVSRFRNVVSSYPFTVGAWLATERLRQLQITPALSPLPMQQAPTSDVVTVELPRSVAALRDLGLVDCASQALTKEESSLRQRFGQGTAELMCKAYGAIGTADRRFAWSREAIGNLDLSSLPDKSSRWRWDCRFPQPYPGIVGELEQRWQLPPGLLYAVMRQESSFRERIRSAVGAVGLTQLLPKTAERLLNDFGAVPQCGNENEPKLDEPRCNLELGARYLHTLLDAFEQQLPLAILSYNAGPEIVNRWLGAKKPLPLDLFLAAVPFPETRNYVHHVLTNFLVYSWLRPGQPELPRVAWTPTGSVKATKDLY